MRTTILMLLLLLSTAVGAQRTVVSGMVTDGATGKPLAGANVTAGGLSVVTNGDGFFILKADTTVAMLTVSHVGYRSGRVGVTAGEQRICLQPATVRLHEVLVVAGDARELVMSAISKICHNYSQRPELYRCFYRETAMKRQRYITVAEGVVDMYKTGYQSGTYRDRVAIRKGRRLLSAHQGDTLGIKVQGGPTVPVMMDLVKNQEQLFTADELDCYDLTMDIPTAIGDRQHFVVTMKPRRSLPYALYHGKLYIDQETLAFTRIELSLDVSDRQKATNVMLVKKPLGVRFRPKELSLLIDYRQGADGLTRLSYLRTTFRFNCDWRRRLFATSFTAFCEMAVTSSEPSASQPIRGRDSFDQRDAFFDKVDYFRDPQFWQDYNIIEPTESLDRAVHRLLKRAR